MNSSWKRRFETLKPWVAFATLLILFSGCQSIFKTLQARGVYHKVQSGQTLFRIAEVYDMDVKTLQRINNIREPKQLQVGRRLWIPNALQVLFVPPTSKWESVGKSKKKTARQKFKNPRSRPLAKLGDYRLGWPVKGGVLTSGFGLRRGRHHDGIDIAAKSGTTISAAAAGEVVFSGKGPTGYGLMVIIKHSKDLMTVYAHNLVNHVGRKMKVKRGQRIALVGNTGRSTGSHLHFEVRNNTHPVNPLKFLPKQ